LLPVSIQTNAIDSKGANWGGSLEVELQKHNKMGVAYAPRLIDGECPRVHSVAETLRNCNMRILALSHNRNNDKNEVS